MTLSLRERQLSQLSAYVADTLGLNFPPARWSDLEHAANSAAKEFGLSDLAALLPWLVSSPLSRQQIETLASHLTVAETYFWREPQIFQALRDPILPDLIRERETRGHRLKILCAGCATGEEPYSIAMLLHELIPDLKTWHITLLATDINPHLLRRAALGVYDEWSFRNAPFQLKDKYFHRRDNGQFELIPQIRNMVTFAYLNLAEDTYPSPMNNINNMDLIFCRNVLIYFVPQRAQEVRQRLFNSLVEGGWLVVAASELSQENFARFAAIRFPGVFVYRREAAPAPDLLPREPTAAQKKQPDLGPATPPGTPGQTVGPDLAGLPASNLVVRVRELAGQGKLSEALLACDQAIAAGRLDPSLHYLHAIILQEQQQDSEAKAALKRALYLDPGFVLAHVALGSLALRRGEAHAAQASFQNALDILDAIGPDDVLPDADGLTAGRLREAMHSALQIGDLTREKRSAHSR